MTTLADNPWAASSDDCLELKDLPLVRLKIKCALEGFGIPSRHRGISGAQFRGGGL